MSIAAFVNDQLKELCLFLDAQRELLGGAQRQQLYRCVVRVLVGTPSVGSKGLYLACPAPGQEFLVVQFVQFRSPLPRWEATVRGRPEEAEDSL